MGFGTPTVELEGDYSTYAVYGSFDDANISSTTQAAAYINCLETKAILITMATNSYVKVYDIDTKTLGSGTLISNSDFYNTDTLSWILKHTFLNTFIALIEKTTYNLLIYKNGVLIQTLTPTNLGFPSSGTDSISFSPRGKYIFLVGTRVASGLKGWVVLKGT